MLQTNVLNNSTNNNNIPPQNINNDLNNNYSPPLELLYFINGNNK